MKNRPQNAEVTSRAGGFYWILLGLAAILGLLFSAIFQADQVLFFNDAPLGLRQADFRSLPEAFTGVWRDLNWVGEWTGDTPPNISNGLALLLGPLAFTKFYTPLTILILGLSAWLFFRQLDFHPAVCVLGGFAAALNIDFFSYACWGLGSHTLAVAMTFLALAALSSQRIRNPWLQAILAGLAVGIGVMEAYDTGAILSLFVALFLVYQLFLKQGDLKSRLSYGGLRFALVVTCAVLISVQTLTSLVSTQLAGVAGMQQSQKSEQQQWDWATQWSLPKKEGFRVLISGLFGYRMDTPDGGRYWGGVGRTPGWKDHGKGMARHSGSGFYAGVLVILLTFWTMGHALRTEQNPFSRLERRWIGFWTIVMIVSLLLAFGRHLWLYRLFYELPYASTIRNPVKFLHPFSIAVVILATFGLAGVYRLYLSKLETPKAALSTHLKSWWQNGPAGDRKWVIGYLTVFGAALLGWLIYSSARTELIQHIQSVGFNQKEQAQAIAQFSIAHFGWFVLFLALSLAAVTLITTGYLNGQRAKWGLAMLAIILITDLSRAAKPWIKHYDYESKYSSNPIIKSLAKEPHKHRVKLFPLSVMQQVPSIERKRLYRFLQFSNFYRSHWLQHLFPFYEIQSLDVVQEPRMSRVNKAYRSAFPPNQPQAQLRLWELTNTRYLFGLGGKFVDKLNRQVAPGTNAFSVIQRFSLYRDRNSRQITAQPNKAGSFALLEYNNALPRAKLFTDWQVMTNRQQSLDRLRSRSFDPHQTVLVNTPAPALKSQSSKPGNGSVDYVDYSPKKITLQASAGQPSVLLLNDKFQKHWEVTVDGTPARLLRCNFLMRGVYLEPGKHQVVFQFQRPLAPLYVSLFAIALGLAIVGYVMVTVRREPPKGAEENGPPSGSH